MSVLKAMRGESAMQFVETARKLEAHAFSVVTKAPKRYGPYLLQPIMALASAVHDNVRAANNTIPKNQHEAQKRRDYLSAANVALQNLGPKLTLLYDAILQNPEKCPWIDNAMEQFGLFIVDEAKLIAKVKKADAERYKDLPPLLDEDELIAIFTDTFIKMCMERYGLSLAEVNSESGS